MRFNPHQIRPWAVTLSSVLLLVLILGLTNWTSTAVQAKPATDVFPREEITGEDGAPMRLVPAGEFTMGSNDIFYIVSNTKPVHRVYVDAFYMDTFEVTTSRYAKFMGATGQEQPRYWSTVRLVSDGDKPVMGVTWHDADAYCRHYGKRLPTEVEWEKAARGTDGRTYPWGNEDSSSRLANYGKSFMGVINVYNQRLTPVGRYESGKSPYGMHDLAGNVWEWVADWYDKDYYRSSPDRNPKGPSSGQFRVLRGGSWVNTPSDLRSATRFWDDPPSRLSVIGFRCAQDIPQ